MANLLRENGFSEYAEVGGMKYFEKGGIICGYGFNGFGSLKKWIAACALRSEEFDEKYTVFREHINKPGDFMTGNYLDGYTESEALASDLAEAYKKRTDEVIGSVVLEVGKEQNANGVYIARIRTDKNKQAINDLGVDGFSGYYFYKKSGSDTEWIYAGRYVATQSGYDFYDCNELNEEVKEIFGKPYICHDQKNGGDFYLDGSRFYLNGQPDD